MKNDRTTYRAMLRAEICAIRQDASYMRASIKGLAEYLLGTFVLAAAVIAGSINAPLAAAMRLRRHRRALGLDTRAIDSALALAASGAMLLGCGLLLWVSGGVQ